MKKIFLLVSLAIFTIFTNTACDLDKAIQEIGDLFEYEFDFPAK